MTKQIVLVCGGRDYDNRSHVFEVLNTLMIDRGPLVVLHGGARGADALGKAWAVSTPGCEEITVSAEWEKYGKGAGHIRNQKMLDDYNPHLIMAFPGGRGTADMTSRAAKQGFIVCSSEGWLISAKQIMKNKDYMSYAKWQELNAQPKKSQLLS